MANTQTDNQPTPILHKADEISVSPKPSPKKSKLTIILLGIFVVLLIGSSTFFLVKSLKKRIVNQQVTPLPTQVVDITVNWKTYTSTKNNFVFKIPSEFVVSESKNSVQLFLSQAALDKSKICKPVLIGMEALPCSPPIIEISYFEVAKDDYTSCEEYINQKQGGIGGQPSSVIMQGQNLTWTVGEASGIDSRPTIRACVFDNELIRFVQTDTYLAPFWSYIHKTLEEPSSVELRALVEGNSQDIENLTSQILSTFKFLDDKQLKQNDPVEIAKKYLEAYISKDWNTVKELCYDQLFDEKIAEGYGLVDYKIISSSPADDTNYYHVYITLTDKSGEIRTTATPEGQPLEVLMIKTKEGNWKALTWYFFS